MAFTFTYTSVVTKKGQRTYPVSSGNIVTFGVTRRDYNRAKKGVLFKYPVMSLPTTQSACYLQIDVVKSLRLLFTENHLQNVVLLVVCLSHKSLYKFSKRKGQNIYPCFISWYRASN